MLLRLGPEDGESGWRDCQEEPRYCPRLQPWVGNRTKKSGTAETVYRLGDLIPLWVRNKTRKCTTVSTVLKSRRNESNSSCLFSIIPGGRYAENPALVGSGFGGAPAPRRAGSAMDRSRW